MRPGLGTLLEEWSVNVPAIIALGSVAIGYAYAFWHFRVQGWTARFAQRGLISRRHPWLFGAGVVVVGLALTSPLDPLSDFLFSAHMVQHLLLIMLAPPLLLFGLPSPIARWFIPEFRLRGVLSLLSDPLVAFALYNVNFYIWHIPDLYEAALHNELLHDLEHALFFYTAILFWWRVIDPTHGWFPLWRWSPAKWIYLLVAAPPAYLLGSILWASGSVIYSFYEAAPRLWELGALADQRNGGLLMWLQGWMFLMASMLVFFVRYDPEEEQV